MAKLLEQLVVPIADLRPYPGNPRRGNLGAITESLTANGQYRPIVVNRRRMEVLAGNHTFLAAKALGWKEILATLLDVDDEQARRILLADNRTNDLAGYDNDELLEQLEECPSLEGTGYDQDDPDELLEEVRGPLPLEEDEVPPPPPEPKTKPGDLYALGGHRLLCGDARDPASYERLLEAERAQLVWTDPPYGVAYEGKTAASLRIENDEPAGLEALLGQSFAAIDGALAEGAPLYVAHPAGARCHAFICAFLTQGWQLRQTLVWVKDALVLGHGDYHYRHEPLLYGYKPAAGRLGRGGAGWFGGNGECSALEVERPRASREHPTMKPPQLIELCLRNSSRRGTLVLDPFAGSGSTLVACERSGRRARLVELDPRYCDVVVERFERLTGERARLL
jgi:DNA modification methylase